MRKKSASFQTSPRRLLSLLLLLVQFFIALAVSYVDGSFTDSLQSRNSPVIANEHFTKEYQLFSVCSEKSVQMSFKNKIDAKGTEKSPLSKIEFVSVGSQDHAIWIIGHFTRKYLCFNRGGKLIARNNGESSDQCKFREIDRNGNIELQSVKNPAWFVGFNKRGRKHKGHDYNRFKGKWKKERCFLFKKRKWEDISKPPTSTEAPFVGHLRARKRSVRHEPNKLKRRGDLSNSAKWMLTRR